MKISKEVSYRSIADLRPHPENGKYNSQLDSHREQALKTSIAEIGIHTPLLILPDGVIISGHQRWKIAQELGYQTVPVREIEEATAEEVLYLLVSENAARRGDEKDLIKKALIIKVLYDAWGITHGGRRSHQEKNRRDVAQEVGENERTVRRLLRLLDLIPEFQQLVSAGKIGLYVGNKIAALDEERQRRAYEMAKCLAEIKLSDADGIIAGFKKEPQQNHNEDKAADQPEPRQTEEKLLSKLRRIENQLERWEAEVIVLPDDLKHQFSNRLQRLAAELRR